MSDEDYRKGKMGLPSSNRGMDYLNGVHDRERNRERYREQFKEKPPSPAPAPILPTYKLPGNDQRPGPTFTRPQPPETLVSMAKSCAGLLCLLFIGYTLFRGHAWTWPQMIGGGAAAAAFGAIAGAALYIAIRILEIALKIAGVLLVIGVALHLLGVLDLISVLSRIGRALGL